MFKKKEQKQEKQQPKYEIKPAPSLPTNLPRANMTTWPQQWEYKWMVLPMVKITDPSEILEIMGTEGWELVAVYPSEIPVVGRGREFFFKRPKLDRPPHS